MALPVAGCGVLLRRSDGGGILGARQGVIVGFWTGAAQWDLGLTLGLHVRVVGI